MPVSTRVNKRGTGQGRRPDLGEMTFAKWVEERKTMSQDEIFDIEAKSQGLIKGKKPSKTKAKRSRKPPTRLPKTRVYPPGWKDFRTNAICLADAGTQTIVAAARGFRTFITSVVFTVGGETDITLNFGTMGSSGAMDFGGTDEPRGIASNHGAAPAPCGQGNFTISSNGAGIAVNGYVIYYQEPDEPPS